MSGEWAYGIKILKAISSKVLIVIWPVARRTASSVWFSSNAGLAMKFSAAGDLSPNAGGQANALEIMLSTKEEKFLTAALTEMFRCVGRKYSSKATSKPEWYCASTWTSEVQDHYRRWLTQIIRREFRYRVSIAKMEAGWFMLNYGWKVNEQRIQQAPARARSGKKENRPKMLARNSKKKK